MFRSFLKVLAVFNWITPAEILVRRMTGGPAYRFFVPEGAGWSGGQIVKMLREQGGIRSHGYMFVRNRYMFCVPERSARFAQFLMNRAGVPVANPVAMPEEPEPKPWERKPQPAPQPAQPGLLTRMGWR